jgi:hypothetical protein
MLRARSARDHPHSLCARAHTPHTRTADDSFVDILSAASWPGVPEGEVLLQPHEVGSGRGVSAFAVPLSCH